MATLGEQLSPQGEVRGLQRPVVDKTVKYCAVGGNRKRGNASKGHDHKKLLYINLTLGTLPEREKETRTFLVESVKDYWIHPTTCCY
jgi:hypothetical protein